MRSRFEWFARWIGCLLLALPVLLNAGGCAYRGVGNLTISEHGADEASASQLSGTFDGYLSREEGGVYTFVAYQRIASDQKFGRYYRNYRKSFPFVQAELTVRINKAGEVVGQPRLLFRQGDHVLTDGPLVGELDLSRSGNRLTITGKGLTWQFDEVESRVVSFELVVHDVLEPAGVAADV